MSMFDRRPALRWTVPLASAGLILAGTTVGSLGAAADDGLPPRTAEELLVSLQQREPVPLSGTVITSADLGLPDLPMSERHSADMADLASGENTLRVWTDGADRSRVALLARSAELDIVRNGRDVWMWSSARNEATHRTLPELDRERDPADLPFDAEDLPSTPQEAAQMVLDALDPTTEVSTSGVGSVAGRPVYELVLDPRDADTLVDRVSIATDAETGVPLRVRVHSTRMADPAFAVAFRSVDFGQPDDSVFEFAPPTGATVTEHPADGDGAGGLGEEQKEELASAAAGLEEPTVVGEGWSTVVIADVGALAALSGSVTEPAEGTADDPAATALGLLEALPTTTGSWGSGRVLSGTLFSAILTDDGRLAVGMVPPEALGTALADQ